MERKQADANSKPLLVITYLCMCNERAVLERKLRFVCLRVSSQTRFLNLISDGCTFFITKFHILIQKAGRSFSNVCLSFSTTSHCSTFLFNGVYVLIAATDSSLPVSKGM